MTNPDCIFCKFASGTAKCNIVWQDADFLAFLDINPISKGHLLLIPREHTSSTLDMTPEAHAKLFERVNLLAHRVKEVVQSPRVGIAVEGFGVDHTHVHVIPIYAEHAFDPSHIYKASEEELAEMQQKLAM